MNQQILLFYMFWNEEPREENKEKLFKKYLIALWL